MSVLLVACCVATVLHSLWVQLNLIRADRQADESLDLARRAASIAEAAVAERDAALALAREERRLREDVMAELERRVGRQENLDLRTLN